jgi:hypothetical protein
MAFNEILFPTEVWPINYTGYLKFALHLEMKLRRR